MTAVIWEDGVEVNSTNDGAIVKSHQEYTINSWDELYDIDVSTCLQGSVVLNIPEGKFAVWDGSENWYETDGTAHSGIPPVPEFRQGLQFFDYYAENYLPNGAVLPIYADDENPNEIWIYDPDLGYLNLDQFEVTVDNSDFTVTKSYDHEQSPCVFITPNVEKGKSVIIFTLPENHYAKLTVTIGGGNPASLYWYRYNGLALGQIYPPQDWVLGLNDLMEIRVYETAQPDDEPLTGSLPIHAYTDSDSVFDVENLEEGGEYGVSIASNTVEGNGVVEISVPSKDVLTYLEIKVQDDGGK